LGINVKRLSIEPSREFDI